MPVMYTNQPHQIISRKTNEKITEFHYIYSNIKKKKKVECFPNYLQWSGYLNSAIPYHDRRTFQLYLVTWCFSIFFFFFAVSNLYCFESFAEV